LPPKKGANGGGAPPRPQPPKGNKNKDTWADPFGGGASGASSGQDSFDPFGSSSGGGFADFANFDKV